MSLEILAVFSMDIGNREQKLSFSWILINFKYLINFKCLDTTQSPSAPGKINGLDKPLPRNVLLCLRHKPLKITFLSYILLGEQMVSH